MPRSKLQRMPDTRLSISAPISKARRATSRPITRKLALQARSEGKRVAILSGGELTVTVRGNGRGGPNQEYALALADLLKDTTGISALAGDTDGADGGAGSATDPAGALIDQATFAKMKSLGWSRAISTTTTPRRSLRRPAICCRPGRR